MPHGRGQRSDWDETGRAPQRLRPPPAAATTPHSPTRWAITCRSTTANRTSPTSATDLPQVLFDCGDARVQAQFINPAADLVRQNLANIDAMVGTRQVAPVEQRGYDAAEIAARRLPGHR